MINKKAFSKTDLSNRIAKADITRLENRKQFWIGFSIFVVWLVATTVSLTCTNSQGSYDASGCGKGSSDK